MTKTRKVQVTLEEEEYLELSDIAAREGRKLASIVRESIEKYALAPEAERSKREALDLLFSVEPTPPPARYADWKREYGARKTKSEREGKEKKR